MYIRHSSCEYNQLVVFREFIDKPDGARSDQVVDAVFMVIAIFAFFITLQMDQGLVEIEHQCVSFLSKVRRQVW